MATNVRQGVRSYQTRWSVMSTEFSASPNDSIDLGPPCDCPDLTVDPLAILEEAMGDRATFIFKINKKLKALSDNADTLVRIYDADSEPLFSVLTLKPGCGPCDPGGEGGGEDKNHPPMVTQFLDKSGRIFLTGIWRKGWQGTTKVSSGGRQLGIVQASRCKRMANYCLLSEGALPLMEANQKSCKSCCCDASHFELTNMSLESIGSMERVKNVEGKWEVRLCLQKNLDRREKGLIIFTAWTIYMWHFAKTTCGPGGQMGQLKRTLIILILMFILCISVVIVVLSLSTTGQKKKVTHVNKTRSTGTPMHHRRSSWLQ